MDGFFPHWVLVFIPDINLASRLQPSSSEPRVNFWIHSNLSRRISAKNSCVRNLEVDGKVINNPSELLEQFNTHFSKIASKLREKLPHFNIDFSRLTNFVHSRKDHDVIFTPWGITVTQVLSILKRVSPNKSAGIDGNNARWPRLAALVITLSIARMLNYSFSTGTFRQHWKPTEVTPLFKKGDASNPSNYRPISVLTVISIKNYWTLRPRFFVWLFSSEQLDLLPHPQGFSLEEMGGFWIYLDSPVFVSTMVLRLLCLKMKVDELLLNLDNNRVSGALLVDYCEAFDMVDNCWN